MVQPNLFTIGQAGKILGVSPKTLKRWEKKGKIKSQRSPGGYRIFTRENLEALKVYLGQSPTPQPSTLPLSEPKPEHKTSGLRLSIMSGILVLSIFANFLLFQNSYLPQNISQNIKSNIADMLYALLEEKLGSLEQIKGGLSLGDREILGDKEVLQASIGSLPLLSPTNLLINSSFEGGLGGYSIIGQSTNDNTKVGNESVRSGTQGLKIEDQTSHIGGVIQLGLSQPKTTTINGRYYVFSLYVRIPTSEVGGAKLRMGLFGEISKSDPVYLQALSKGELNSSYYTSYSSDRYEDHSLSNLPSNEWVRISSSFENLPLGKYPIIEVIDYQGGAIYIDDLSLSEGILNDLNHFTLGTQTISFPYEQNNIKLADNAISSDSYGNIYPTGGFTGSIGTDGVRFASLYLTKLTIDKDGDIDTSGVINAKEITVTSTSVTSTFSGDLSVGGELFLSDGTAALPSLTFTNDTNTGIFRPTTDIIALTTAGTERLRIDSSGNVGIGTASLTTKLVISGTSGDPARITTLSTGVDSISGIQFTNDARTWNLQVQGSDSDKLYMYDATAAQTRMVIDSSGNVGIGTADPTSQLHLGSGALGAVNTVDGLAFGYSAGANFIQATRNGANNGEIILRALNAGSANANQLYLSYTGNVGIGVNPANKLSVNGSAKLIGALSTTSVTLGFGDDAGTFGWSIGNGIIDSTHNFRIYDNTAGLARVTVNGDGNVGIGTAVPDWILHLKGTSPNLAIEGTGVRQYRLFVDNADGKFGVFDGTAGAHRVNIDTSGNFKITMPGTQNTVALCHATNGTQSTPDSIVDCSGAPSDIAEWYETKPEVEIGDVVSPSGETITFQYASGIGVVDGFEEVPLEGKDQKIAVLQKSQKGYDSTIIGIVSQAPYQTFGEDVKEAAQYPQRIALVGRVPVKFSIENGTVVPGDFLTSSETRPGYSMKATKKGRVIGVALEEGLEDGKIMVFINPTWYEPELAESLALEGEEVDYLTVNNDLNVLGKTTTNDLGVTGKITTGLLVVDGLTGSINSLSELKIQDLGLGSINFLNGKVTIDTDGNLTSTSTIKGKNFAVSGDSTGNATLPANQTEVEITSSFATETSRIFVTSRTQTGGQPLHVTSRSSGKFTVTIEQPYSSDIIFDYWVIN